MNEARSVKRVILAVDLKAEDPKVTLRIWNALAPLLEGEACVVEPVTVLDRQDAAMGNYFRNRIGTLRTAVERHLGEHLSSLGLEGFAPPKVVYANGSSTHQAVQALLRHGKKTGCELIAVGSHSRKGAPRFFLGSFAETLALESSIPLLVANPFLRLVPQRVKTLLFPTDFSAASKAGLERVTSSFSESKPKILLFHSFVSPVRFFMDPFAAYPVTPAMVEDELGRRRKIGERWCQELRTKGFGCTLLVDRKSEPVSEAILDAARRQKANLVTMTSTSGKWETRLLGSTTRQVLRSAPMPVWVVHPFRRVPARLAMPKRSRPRARRALPARSVAAAS